MSPQSGSPWHSPDVVAGFRASPPNAELVGVAEAARPLGARRWLLDIGCGAGRNAVPLARLGWHVIGLDLSPPMIRAAAARAEEERLTARLQLAVASMTQLPVPTRSCHFVVAHGIWNLARSTAEFRAATREAARVAVPGAVLFVFTFSRHTIPEGDTPVEGEAFVFTGFSGAPQCFLTEAQLVEELGDAGFAPEPGRPIAEHNRPRPGALPGVRTPVIYEGVFRRRD
jgi:SAM-dependent methyltransferase